MMMVNVIMLKTSKNLTLSYSQYLREEAVSVSYICVMLYQVIRLSLTEAFEFTPENAHRFFIKLIAGEILH